MSPLSHRSSSKDADLAVSAYEQDGGGEVVLIWVDYSERQLGRNPLSSQTSLDSK